MFLLTPILVMILGVLLLATGLLFRVMHWPDMFHGLYSGWIILIIGFVWLMIKRKKFEKKNLNK